MFDSLFAMPSFIRGAARVLDLGATTDEYNTSDNEREADTNALHSDWKAVGNDMFGALDGYKAREPKRR
ncbi:hypothetical protein [Levilactobacillus fuyuanensis]|uniref:Uncharacterized protein n=1 Tax=Levilactobacillus fuyuanensis TaxID=2486022 RepID=A0ABW4GZY5_9LACO|nr:hypothetical protein [Levilactobacillus fuyuanensis]